MNNLWIMAAENGFVIIDEDPRLIGMIRPKWVAGSADECGELIKKILLGTIKAESEK